MTNSNLKKIEYGVESKMVPSYVLPKYRAWTYFIPPIYDGDAVLVFETSMGDDILAIAPLARHTIALCANIKIAEAIQSRLTKEQHGYDITIVVSSPIDLPFRMHSFDFVIARNFFYLWNINRNRGKELCGNLFSLLRKTGTALIGCKDRPVNDFSSYIVNLVRSCMTRGSNFHSVVRGQFNAIQNIFFCMPDHITCEEIISLEWMRHRQNNPFSLRKWVKNTIITCFFPYGCPNTNYIVQVNKSPSLIQLILVKVSRVLEDTHHTLKIHQILIGNPSTIICIVSLGVREFVIRIPMTSNALTRAERQVETLNYLQSFFNQNIRPTFPEVYQPFKVLKQIVFVEEKLSGEVYEVASSFDKFNEDNAVQWLIDFHQSTQQVVENKEICLYELIDVPFGKLMSCLRTDKEKKILTLLQKKISNFLSLTPMKTVCMHGDYKIENMTFSKKDKKVIGVFDWDLSIPRGLPLLDLLYFIVYSDKLRNSKMQVNEIFIEKFIKGNIKDYEKKWIYVYAEKIGIDISCLQFFSVISWVYNIVFRTQMEIYSIDDWYSVNIESYLYATQST